MTEFDKLLDQLASNLEHVVQISELYGRVIDIAKGSVQSLQPYLSSNPNTGSNPVANQIAILERLPESPLIKDLLPIVYGQQVVLMISGFEAHLKDIVKTISNHHMYLIGWPENSSGKVDLAELSRDSVTIGDLVMAILEQKGVNFQDLQATKRFFQQYLQVELDIDTVHEQGIILASAIRHAVIHSNGVADIKFVKQIRGLDDVRSLYSTNQPIEIKEQQVIEFRDSILNAARLIRESLNAKVTNAENQ